MMKAKLTIALILWLFVAGCDKQPKTDDHTVWRIDPDMAVKTDFHQFIDSISLVPLETNNDCLIKNVQELYFINNKFYINNNDTEVQVYNKNGKFLYGTRKHLGAGPNDYTSVVSFSVLPNDTIEILDANFLKMRYFIYPKGFVRFNELPRDILPVSQHMWLNKDTCIFSEGSTENPILKMYSKKKAGIIKYLEDKQKGCFVKTSTALYQTDGQLYISAPYPSNELYTIDESLNKKLILRLDFGKYNFSMDDLPENMSVKSSADYYSAHHEYVYPFSKYISDDFQICFFQHKESMNFAYKNKKTGTEVIFKNEVKSKPQFLVAQYAQKDKLFYASEPGYIPYLVDTTLMNKEDIEKMKRIKETDNPIVIIYTMK